MLMKMILNNKRSNPFPSGKDCGEGAGQNMTSRFAWTFPPPGPLPKGRGVCSKAQGCFDFGCPYAQH